MFMNIIQWSIRHFCVGGSLLIFNYLFSFEALQMFFWVLVLVAYCTVCMFAILYAYMCILLCSLSQIGGSIYLNFTLKKTENQNNFIKFRTGTEKK
jgi:hypothetical protein